MSTTRPLHEEDTHELLHALTECLRMMQEFVSGRTEQDPARPPTPERLLTIDQVAERLGVSRRTVNTLIAEGELRPLRIRAARRFMPGAVEDYLRRAATRKR